MVKTGKIVNDDFFPISDETDGKQSMKEINLEKYVDSILEQYDKNDDGFVDWSEYKTSKE